MKKTPILLDVDMVWAAACAAYRINGEYFSSDQIRDETKITSNKSLMKNILADSGKLIDDDYKNGKIVRQYWLSKLSEILAETAQDFTKESVRVATMQEIFSNDYRSLGIIAYLPVGYVRNLNHEQKLEKKETALSISQHFGSKGEIIAGEAVVLDCNYSKTWCTYYITAQFSTKVILFTYRSPLELDTIIKFTGKIKAHRENKITQIKSVRIT